MRKGMPTTYHTFEMSVCTGGGGGMWDCHHQFIYTLLLSQGYLLDSIKGS